MLGDADAAVERHAFVVVEALRSERLVVAEGFLDVGVLQQDVVAVVQVGVQHRALGPRRLVRLPPPACELGRVVVEDAVCHAAAPMHVWACKGDLTKHPLVFVNRGQREASAGWSTASTMASMMALAITSKISSWSSAACWPSWYRCG